MIIYVDTSAAMKLLVDEQESTAIAGYLERQRDSHLLVSSFLLHVELHRAASRRPEHIDHSTVTDVLTVINLVDLEHSDLMTAAALPGRLRSNDAIHMATALRLGADVVAAYDKELLAASIEAGFSVAHPS